MSLTKETFHPAIRACIGAQQAFRKLGFPGKDLYAGLAGTAEEEQAVLVILRTQGKEFTIEVGQAKISEAEFTLEWARACKIVNAPDFPDTLMREIYEESVPFQNSVSFMLALINAGIELPKKTT